MKLWSWLIVWGMMAVGSNAEMIAGWELTGVDLDDGIGIESAGAPYRFLATSKSVNLSADLTLGGGVNPTTTSSQYGFKISSADEQTTLSGAIASEHYLQFTLVAEQGYRLDLSSIEMSGESSGSGADNVALMSSVEGFSAGNEMTSLSGRQGVTGGLDTDSTGWGSAIDVSGSQYQDLTSVTFRIYGWNSTSGSGVTSLRNLSGNDLVINGSVEAIPEPTVLGLVSLAGIGLLVGRRLSR